VLQVRVDNEPLVHNWHMEIVDDCETILGRSLTEVEANFITSRCGFTALETIRDEVRSLAGKPEELQQYLRSGRAGAEDEHVHTKYRAAWVAILRWQSIARALRYAAFGTFALSLLDLVPRPPVSFLALVLTLVSVATQIAIRCPRCRAWWPLGTDDDGRRKPCKRCQLRWGQEDELPET
jgi:hypothetical protein